MPPKRKRADDATTEASTAASTRATRSSTRASNSNSTAPTSSSAPKSAAAKQASTTNVDNIQATAPAPKKTKVTKTPAKSAGRGARGRKAGKEEAGVGTADKGDSLTDEDISKEHKPSSLETSDTSSRVPVPVPSTKATKTQPPPAADEPYTPKRSAALFAHYADNDDPSVIGPEGFEKLCSDANISLDGAMPLILAWQFGAKEMAKITKEEWNTGSASLKAASIQAVSLVAHDLHDILFSNKAIPTKKQKDPYDRTALRNYAGDRKTAFHKLYSFSFLLAKPEQSRNIDMETAAALWSVLLVPKYPLMSEVIEFINTKEGTYKAANKDLWAMMLEFCETVDPNLSDYERDGAWPTLLDDFVSWKKSKGEGQSTTD